MGPTWLQGIAYTAVIITAVGVIVRKALLPLFRMLRTASELVETTAPILLEIAKEFRNESSLPIVINELKTTLTKLTTVLEADHTYLHEWRHELNNQMAVVHGRLEVADADIQTLKNRSYRIRGEQ